MQFHTVLDHQARGLNLIGIIDIKKVRIDCRQHISAVQRRSLGLIRGGLLQALFQRLLVIRRTCNKRQILVTAVSTVITKALTFASSVFSNDCAS